MPIWEELEHLWNYPLQRRQTMFELLTESCVVHQSTQKTNRAVMVIVLFTNRLPKTHFSNAFVVS